jgi:tripartite-type tricarboxylate transporter receptor subunit TctC
VRLIARKRPQSQDELIAYTKASPGKVKIASAGNGTSQHIAMQLFTGDAGSAWHQWLANTPKAN